MSKLLISFSGAQCTGKTTLLKRLRDCNSSVNFVPEVTRLIKRDYGVDINEAGNEMTQALIITEHFKNINNHNKQERSSILDRCILDGLIYTSWLEDNKALNTWTGNYAYHLFDNYIESYDVIFYTDSADVKIEDDGERSIDIGFRNDIISDFEHWIECNPRLKERVVVLSGTVEERLEIIKRTLSEKGLDINIK